MSIAKLQVRRLLEIKFKKKRAACMTLYFPKQEIVQ